MKTVNCVLLAIGMLVGLAWADEPTGARTIWDSDVLDHVVFKKEGGVLYWAWKRSCEKVTVSMCDDEPCGFVISSSMDQWEKEETVCDWKKEIPGRLMRRLME